MVPVIWHPRVIVRRPSHTAVCLQTHHYHNYHYVFTNKNVQRHFSLFEKAKVNDNVATQLKNKGAYSIISLPTDLINTR